ncbi:MAG TPA: glycogen/starch synthase [Anaerolineaceae bacterium]
MVTGSLPELRVLFIAAEAAPFVKVGGLGDVAGSLPTALRKLPPEETGGVKLDVRLCIPYHSVISSTFKNNPPVAEFPISRGNEILKAQVYQTIVNGVPVYLIAGDMIPPDAPVYSLDTPKDGEKYTFFSTAALALSKQINWQVDILHANDWHTALVPYILRKLRSTDPDYARVRSVLTIHNLPFMGGGTEKAIAAYGLPYYEDTRLPKWARAFPLPLGLTAADHIVAVSKTYAAEILTPEFGCNLQNYLLSRAKNISGVINGLDTDAWNPEMDTAIASSFDEKSLAKRQVNKTALLSSLSLDPDPGIPLLIMVSRIDQQKGVDLIPSVLRQVSDLPWQAILLGNGDPNLEISFTRLEMDFPERVRSIVRFDSALSHRMYAGGDVILMPSRYEPCGLAQMIAMRYGCLPLARATGGLQDSIIDDPDPEKSTGFLFKTASIPDFEAALRRVLKEFRDQDGWQKRQVNAMRQDFSWTHSAIEYFHIYQSLLEPHT